MRKNLIFYSLAFALVCIVFMFFNWLYQEMILYSGLTNRTNTIYGIYQNISRQIRSAAISSPDLVKAGETTKSTKLFYTGRQSIVRQLDLLIATVTDSKNIEISRQLNARARAEMDWIVNSNVPDSIIHHKSPDHLASLILIDSLIDSGIEKTNFLQLDHKDKLQKMVTNMRTWLILFIIISGVLLMDAFINLSRQKLKTRYREKEIADCRYALDEAAIVAFTDQKGIISYVNDNFCAISKLSAACTE